MRSIRRPEPLTPQQEVELGRRIQAGDAEAMGQLVEGNLRFVVRVAKEYQRQGLTLEELVSAGNEGLVAAARRFDPERGCKFITYAVWWIRQAIVQAVADQSAVRLPASQLHLRAKVGRAYAQMRQHDDRVTFEDVAEATGCQQDWVEQVLGGAHKLCRSLDGPGVDGDEAPLLENLPDLEQSSPETDAMQASLRDEVTLALKSLEGREAQVVALYFGLAGDGGLTLQEIGDRMGLTRERVRQIKEAALGKLRLTESCRRLAEYEYGS